LLAFVRFLDSILTPSLSNFRTGNLQDVSNANGRNGINGKPGKVNVAKRSNGVKTRSMSIGNANNELVVAASSRNAAAGAFSNHESRNPAVSARDTFERNRIKADPNSYQLTGNADDIDERDKEDPLCATEYVADMYVYYREKEAAASVRPVFMESQPHINERMRAILVDWLVEVHAKFKLVPETLYLTINLIDRYLEQETVTRPKLQLVGVTALLIGSKYEEIYPPELRDLVYICDRAYTRQDIIEMEVSCCSLDCCLFVGSPACFQPHCASHSHTSFPPACLLCPIRLDRKRS